MVSFAVPVGGRPAWLSVPSNHPERGEIELEDRLCSIRSNRRTRLGPKTRLQFSGFAAAGPCAKMSRAPEN